jgi:hypothetical protein
MSIKSHGRRDCFQTLCKESLCKVHIKEIDAKGRVTEFE